MSELFLTFLPSEQRKKLIPHSHSPNRAEGHSAILLQLVFYSVEHRTHISIGFLVLTTVVKDRIFSLRDPLRVCA
jgi:hypothetical protein